MLKEVIPEVSLGSEAEGHSKTARKDELQQLDDLWPDKRPAHMFKEMVPEVSLGSEAEGQAWRRPHSRAAWKREPSAASKWSLAKMQRLPKPTRIMSYGVTGWKTTQQQSSQRHPSRWFPRYSRGRGHLYRRRWTHARQTSRWFPRNSRGRGHLYRRRWTHARQTSRWFPRNSRGRGHLYPRRWTHARQTSRWFPRNSRGRGHLYPRRWTHANYWNSYIQRAVHKAVSGHLQRMRRREAIIRQRELPMKKRFVVHQVNRWVGHSMRSARAARWRYGYPWRKPHSRAAWKREPRTASKWSLAKMQAGRRPHSRAASKREPSTASKWSLAKTQAQPRLKSGATKGSYLKKKLARFRKWWRRPHLYTRRMAKWWRSRPYKRAAAAAARAAATTTTTTFSDDRFKQRLRVRTERQQRYHPR
eukprot:TRINITY_DN1836_c0_g1_i1.p1 TRINITY_DN1836_c0_g1~~TRINITY_DN1836_c0_g1_i1.p1  ORF type:complete len:417 (+),score=15.08 TRINITY_DN1836_c0_g1_i1:191-1441(+)